MSLEKDLEAIRQGMEVGRFGNEAAVSQGVVLRILHGLGWPTYETQVVWPEYWLSGRRVDFALCHPPGKPIAIIEVKQVGQSNGAERQLFEYAFHDGVPMAILTDGREWNFFLPGEQGDYGERRVYKLDIVDRDLIECTGRLCRYLRYADVSSGAAMEAARGDYRDVSKTRQIAAALPKAWNQIILEEDEMLLEIVADKVESLCGFKPTPDAVADFLKQCVLSGVVPPSQKNQPISPTNSSINLVIAQPARSPTLSRQGPHNIRTGIGLTIAGKFYSARNAIEVLKLFFEEVTKIDPSFPERFGTLQKHGRTRRYLARDPNLLYPEHPDLCLGASVRLTSGWWLGTNCSRQSIARILEIARPLLGDPSVAAFQYNLGEQV